MKELACCIEDIYKTSCIAIPLRFQGNKMLQLRSCDFRIFLCLHKPFVFIACLMFLSGKRGADGKLSSAQTALMLQEETIRRLERERKTLNEKMEALETSLAQSDAERRQLKDKVAKLQMNDAKIEQEKEAMRSQIENAESRITRIDLKKRGVEGIY